MSFLPQFISMPQSTRRGNRSKAKSLRNSTSTEETASISSCSRGGFDWDDDESIDESCFSDDLLDGSFNNNTRRGGMDGSHSTCSSRYASSASLMSAPAATLAHNRRSSNGRLLADTEDASVSSITSHLSVQSLMQDISDKDETIRALTVELDAAVEEAFCLEGEVESVFSENAELKAKLESQKEKERYESKRALSKRASTGGVTAAHRRLSLMGSANNLSLMGSANNHHHGSSNARALEEEKEMLEDKLEAQEQILEQTKMALKNTTKDKLALQEKVGELEEEQQFMEEALLEQFQHTQRQQDEELHSMQKQLAASQKEAADYKAQNEMLWRMLEQMQAEKEQEMDLMRMARKQIASAMNDLDIEDEKDTDTESTASSLDAAEFDEEGPLEADC